MEPCERRSPPAPTLTGNADDDEQLLRLHQSGGLVRPRRWSHFLYFADEPHALEASTLLEPRWEAEVQRVHGGAGWQVAATGTVDAVVAPRVTELRAWFTAFASEHGGEYDGWRAWA
jgi:hypothetical protein